jgi:phosphatidate cytidylyltransferase
MMTISNALHNEIFLTYLAVSGGLLGFAGVVLGILTAIGKKVSSIWKTYRGWLVMAPLVLGTIFLGRTATIIGVSLLAIFGFKEFARATGLYDDWWLTGLVYLGIVLLGTASFVTDPRLGYPGWYGLFMASPAYVVGALLLVPILRNRAKGQLQQVALAIVGFIYFGWMFSHLGFLANSEFAYGYILYLIVYLRQALWQAQAQGEHQPQQDHRRFDRRHLRFVGHPVAVVVLVSALRALASGRGRSGRGNRWPTG